VRLPLLWCAGPGRFVYAPPTMAEQTDSEYVNLRLRRSQLGPVRDLMRAHGTELPTTLRQDIDRQLKEDQTTGGTEGPRGSSQR
jgi:hypothetical protein